MMEETMFIKRNQGKGAQSLHERKFHLWPKDSSTLFQLKDNLEKYETHPLETNIIFENKGGSFRLTLTQQRSGEISMLKLDTTNGLLAVEEENSTQGNKLSLKRANRHYFEFCGTDMHQEYGVLRKIDITLSHIHIWPFHFKKTTTVVCIDHVLKSDRNCITGGFTSKFNYDHQNGILNHMNSVVLNSFISEANKFVQTLSSIDNIRYNHTGKLYSSESLNHNKTYAIMSYSETSRNRSWKSWLPELLNLISIELMHSVFIDSNDGTIQNNKISSISSSTGNYSAQYDKNVIIKLRKVTPIFTHHKGIKSNPANCVLSKSDNHFNATIKVNFNCAIPLINSKGNFHNSIKSFSKIVAKKKMLQWNYKHKMGKRAMSHYLFDFKNFSKNDPCLKNILIKVGYPDCVIYSERMKNIGNILKISTVELYDKLSDSIKCLHERLEGPKHFFDVKHIFATSIKKEGDHQRFMKQRSEYYIGKSDNARMNDMVQKCIKNHLFVNSVQNTQYKRRIMSVSTQTDPTIFIKVSRKCKKTVGSQTGLSFVTCSCSDRRSNVSCKRKLEALNLETLPSKKVYTYKNVSSVPVGNKTIISEEINPDQQRDRKGNDSCELYNENAKSDSMSELRPVAKKNVFHYSNITESNNQTNKLIRSHLEASAGNCCRRGIRLGLSKKVRPGRKLAL